MRFIFGVIAALVAFTAAAATLATAGAPASPADDLARARNLAATCASCHGTDGVSQPGMATLAGMPRDKLVAAMRAYKAGTRPSTVMRQLARGYTDAQIERLATWFAAEAPR